jgi:hypothetical protein
MGLPEEEGPKIGLQENFAKRWVAARGPHQSPADW